MRAALTSARSNAIGSKSGQLESEQSEWSSIQVVVKHIGQFDRNNSKHSYHD